MSSLSEKVRIKLFGTLNGDGTLGTLAPGGVHHIVAPPSGSSPFIVTHRASNVAVHAVANNNVLDRDLWFIKTSCASDASTTASAEEKNEAVLARIEALLDGKSFSVTGAVIQLMRTGDIPPIVTPLEGEGNRYFIQMGAIYETTAIAA